MVQVDLLSLTCVKIARGRRNVYPHFYQYEPDGRLSSRTSRVITAIAGFAYRIQLYHRRDAREIRHGRFTGALVPFGRGNIETFIDSHV